jgi:hypothetical protein
MRIQEIITESLDLGELIEDDADDVTIDLLADTLRELQFSASDAQVPKISVQALINLIKMKPGGEAFTLESLKSAQQYSDLIKNMIVNIKDDDSGVKYVYLKPMQGDVDDMDMSTADSAGVKTAPEKTVGSMAKRALNKRD